MPLLGRHEVHPDRVVLDWSDCKPEAFFGALFAASFSLADGIVELPGVWGRTRPDVVVRGALQDALRQTFLQHGKTARKKGERTPHAFEVDDQPRTALLQRYEWYIHQDQGEVVGKAVATGKEVALAGWANPGAVQRHVAHGSTQIRYSAEEAVCACFALVGSLSLLTPRGGILVLPEPTDLRAFAEVRPVLTPRSIGRCTVGGVGDAVLRAEMALRGESVRTSGVGRVSAILFRSTPWASQQKSRVDVLPAQTHTSACVERYATLVEQLPARVIPVAPKKNRPGDIFVVPNSLRAFVADNLARGRAWYAGFADARDVRDRDRFLHLRWEANNLGALRLEEANGVRAMNETLEEAERLLVLSVHNALSRRFGVIADENQNNERAMKNRFNRERERWRLAFAGAKTREQLRFALADLWSRAGQIQELVEGWQGVVALVRNDWQAARDLSLVALASYASRSGRGDDAAETSPEPLTPS